MTERSGNGGDRRGESAAAAEMIGEANIEAAETNGEANTIAAAEIEDEVNIETAAEACRGASTEASGGASTEAGAKASTEASAKASTGASTKASTKASTGAGNGGVRRRWRYPSRWGEEKRVLSRLRMLSLRCGFSLDQSEDVTSAAAEACLNAAEHGNGMNPERYVTVEFFFSAAKGAARLRVYDEGPGADASKLRGREASAAEGSDRGWGLLIMGELADRVEHFQGRNGFCTELTFIRKQGG